MCVGDSDSVSQGGNLLIWGYPDVRWVNFDTPGRIDVSQGFVSGFDAETGLSEKAWISLSSTISSGNSGGGAYNELGQLVGVPTAVFQGNLSSRGLLRPMNLVLDYFDSFYFVCFELTLVNGSLPLLGFLILNLLGPKAYDLL